MRTFFQNSLSVILPGALSLGGTFLLNLYSDYYSWPAQYFIFGFIAFFFFFNLLYARKTGTEQFTGLLLTGLVVKLLLALVIVAIVAFAYEDLFLSFAIHFMLYYVLFTFFEIRSLSYLIKHQSPKHT